MQAGKPANHEQPQKAQCIDHRGVPVNPSLPDGRHPVEGLDGGGYRHDEGQEGEHNTRIDRLPRGEHMVPPHEEADDGNCEAGERHEVIAEHASAGEGGYHLTDDAHARHNHNINRRMGVEPEQVLEQDGVAPRLGSKIPMPKLRSTATNSSVMATTGVPST
jgi:hypothetical protein